MARDFPRHYNLRRFLLCQIAKTLISALVALLKTAFTIAVGRIIALWKKSKSVRRNQNQHNANVLTVSLLKTSN